MKKYIKSVYSRPGYTGRGTTPVRYMSVSMGEKVGIDDVPSMFAHGSVSGMRRQYWGDDALLVRCGQYIYNVSSEPTIYYNYAKAR